MRNTLKNQDGFFSFLGILLAVVIAAILFNWTAEKYFKPSQTQDQTTQNFISSSGIDTANYSSVLDSTVQKIRAIEKNQLNRPNEIMAELNAVNF